MGKKMEKKKDLSLGMLTVRVRQTVRVRHWEMMMEIRFVRPKGIQKAKHFLREMQKVTPNSLSNL